MSHTSADQQSEEAELLCANCGHDEADHAERKHGCRKLVGGWNACGCIAFKSEAEAAGPPNQLLNQAVNQFMNDALIAIAGAVATPEKGYVEDGGLGLLLSDIKRLRKQHDELKTWSEQVRNFLLHLCSQVGKPASDKSKRHDIDSCIIIQFQIERLQKAVVAYWQAVDGHCPECIPSDVHNHFAAILADQSTVKAVKP